MSEGACVRVRVCARERGHLAMRRQRRSDARGERRDARGERRRREARGEERASHVRVRVCACVQERGDVCVISWVSGAVSPSGRLAVAAHARVACWRYGTRNSRRRLAVAAHACVQERGDLAVQLQRREQEVADLRYHNEQLEVGMPARVCMARQA